MAGHSRFRAAKLRGSLTPNAVFGQLRENLDANHGRRGPSVGSRVVKTALADAVAVGNLGNDYDSSVQSYERKYWSDQGVAIGVEAIFFSSSVGTESVHGIIMAL